MALPVTACGPLSGVTWPMTISAWAVIAARAMTLAASNRTAATWRWRRATMRCCEDRGPCVVFMPRTLAAESTESMIKR